MANDINTMANNEPSKNENIQGNSKVEIDYDRIAKIVEGKQSATEDSVLKGYFKQQGLSEDEMKQAISKFKEDKAARTPDISSLNQQLVEANERAKTAELKVEAMTLANELGVSMAKAPYLIRMADLSDVETDGQIDKAKLKESLSAVLNDIPELKSTIENNVRGGFKIGADKNENNKNTNEELARIFGVKMK